MSLRQGGEFNVEYANNFPELASLNLTRSTVLEQVTQDKYNFATVSCNGRSVHQRTQLSTFKQDVPWLTIAT